MPPSIGPYELSNTFLSEASPNSSFDSFVPIDLAFAWKRTLIRPADNFHATKQRFLNRVYN